MLAHTNTYTHTQTHTHTHTHTLMYNCLLSEVFKSLFIVLRFELKLEFNASSPQFFEAQFYPVAQWISSLSQLPKCWNYQHAQISCPAFLFFNFCEVDTYSSVCTHTCNISKCLCSSILSYMFLQLYSDFFLVLSEKVLH